MSKKFIVQPFALCAAVCMCAVPLRAQQLIPLEIPEIGALYSRLAANPQILSADLRVRGAEARVRSARLLRGPASAFFDAEEIAANDLGGANLAAGVEHEFTPRAQRDADIATATADLNAAAALRDGVRVRLESHVARAFLEAVVHQRIAARLAQEDTLLQRAEVTLNSRFSVGQARYVDVIRLRTERLRAQADLLDANAAVSRGMLRLRAIIGDDIPPSSVSSVTLRLPTSQVNVDSLIAQSPALRLAIAERDRTRAALSVAAAQGARRFSGQLGLQRFAQEDGGSAFGPTVGVTVSLPFTTRKSNHAAVEAAQLDTAAAAQHSMSSIASLRADVVNALALIQATERRIAGVDQQLINAAREERQAALIAYANGELTLAELLDFERSLSRAEVQLLQSYDAAIDAWDHANQLLAGANTEHGDDQ